MVQGGGGERLMNPPWVFDMLQYFETIFAFSWKPLIFKSKSSLQDKVYFMGGGAAGGPWRHQDGCHLGCMVAILAAILNFIKN